MPRPPGDPRVLLGRRVSLRHRLPSPGPGGRYSDAVGELDQDRERWLVHTRRGPVVVDPADVVAVREVPPARPRRAPLGEVAALERVCARAWPAPVTRPLGEWLLRAAGGFTGRANSALVIADPGLPVPDALAAVVHFAAAHGVAPLAQVAQTTPWEAAVRRAGWVVDESHPVSVRVARLPDIPAGSRAEAAIEIADAPTSEWWRLVAGTARPSETQRAVLGSGLVGFGLARIDGEVVGAVRAALVDEWVHLARLTIGQAWRRRGLGRALTVAAAGWAAQHGARHAVLQVSQDDAAADRLYSGLGFTEHHRYRYWAPPVSGSGA
ncbi:MAG: GNAT family N-acetyltransferase [Pseudonocardiaceae bacterium]|nr:GNAT family N-acetyltransferase [Pseudonocardiaceae bacterium]